MSPMASQITSPGIVCSTVYSGADQRKHQSSASLAFVRGIHRGSGNSPHKWPVTRKMFPFDDVIIKPKRQSYQPTFWPEKEYWSGQHKSDSRVVFQILSGALYWHWHRFTPAVRQNGGTSGVIPYNWRAVYVTAIHLIDKHFACCMHACCWGRGGVSILKYKFGTYISWGYFNVL